jgi:hypothetical protein
MFQTDHCLRDFDAEFAQLAVNAWCTQPGLAAMMRRINSLTPVAIGETTVTTATIPTPIQPKTFAMLCDHRFRFHDAKHRFPVRDRLRESQTQRDDQRPTTGVAVGGRGAGERELDGAKRGLILPVQLGHGANH